MKKVCVVVASRANYGRIKSVMREINNHPELELQVVVSASALLRRFGKVEDIIKRDGFQINYRANTCFEAGESPGTMGKTTGVSIVELSTAFENLRPDMVLTVADRYETIATAIAASYMNIVVVHTQGGEVTGSIDESVRHAITKLSHVHFPATKKSLENIIKMGEDPETVFHVGCPALDIVAESDKVFNRSVLDKYDPQNFSEFDLNKPYLLVIQHPVTTENGSAAEQVKQTLDAVHESGLQAIWLWPNIDAGSDQISKVLRCYKEDHRGQSKVRFSINFEVEDYIKILANSACIVGNSSSGIREGSLLGIPCVNIGSRQNCREKGRNVLNVDCQSEEIFSAIMTQLDHGKYEPEFLYGEGLAGKKIAEILSKINPKVQKTLHYNR